MVVMNIHGRRFPRTETNEIRDLLEANLSALHALLDEHRRALTATLTAVESMRGEIHSEIRALADVRAPWVAALAETRALLYVALKEIVVGESSSDTHPGIDAARLGGYAPAVSV